MPGMNRMPAYLLLLALVVACRQVQQPDPAPVPKTRTMTVRLVDEDGKPVLDVAANLWWSEDPDAEWGNADRDFEAGIAILEDVPSGPFTLCALPPGFVVPTKGCPRKLVPAGVAETTIVYDVGEERTLRILGWREDASGILYLAAKEDLEPSQHGIEDDGTVRLEGLRSGVRYNIYVRDFDNGRCALLRDLSADEPWPEIELGQGKDVTGRVILPEGYDYANVAILVDRAVMIDGSVASGGDFRIKAVPDGVFTVVAYTNVGDRYHAANRDVRAGESVTLDLTK